MSNINLIKNFDFTVHKCFISLAAFIHHSDDVNKYQQYPDYDVSTVLMSH